MNELLYNFAVWLDTHQLSTSIHESYYMYNWIETTHVLTLMVSLGLLFIIDLRILGYALPGVPASTIADRLQWPMLAGFSIMVITGLLLVYAIPVRSVQSLWLRLKIILIIAAAINAFVFHREMKKAEDGWDITDKAPGQLRVGAALSIAFWSLIVICGRFIAYDWFDCEHQQSQMVITFAGCIADQTQF